ncbi:MAG TPA: class I SAM-dependent methyltransferase [Thermoanaerobaculia bacterium]|nr:class I SAM-dependent methyltransferase [Thermoanaerobaculia bacterium]
MHDVHAADETGYFDREYFQLHPGKVKYLDYLVGLLRAHGVPGGRVLDVGAGYGFFLSALEKAGYEASGIEVSAHAVEQARRRTRGQIVEQGAEEPFPFPDGHFDAVTLLDVIEHLKDYAATLESCRRCLKPGGKLFVITLNAHSLARPLLGRRWAWYQDPTHVHMFTPRMLRAGLEGAGLAVETLITESNFCSVGEGTKFLKPLRVIGRVVHTPAFGDSLLAVAKRPR